MKVCLNIYKSKEALNYSISKNKKYPELLYYFEEHNLFNFDKITYILDKTKNLHNTKINIEKFAAYITTINDINHFLKHFDDTCINDTWKKILESLKEKVNSNESLYFKIELKN